MNQKGFANIVLIVVVVAIVAVGGYFVSSKKLTKPNENQQIPQSNDEPNRGQGATIIPEKDRIQILFPQGGEKLEVGQSYGIRWNFPSHQRNATATIFLWAVPPSAWIKYEKYDDVIAENVPARGGTYQWKVTQPAFDNYSIDIYSPEIGTEFRGISKPFSIVGGNPLAVDISPEPPFKTDNLIINFPLPRQEVTSPIIIKGKARNIFFEGEFTVELRGYDYPLGHPQYAESSKIVTSTYAIIVDENCDWIRGEWCDFKSVVNYPPSGTGIENMLYFYAGGEGPRIPPAGSVEDMLKYLRGEHDPIQLPPKFIGALPIWLK